MMIPISWVQNNLHRTPITAPFKEVSEGSAQQQQYSVGSRSGRFSLNILHIAIGDIRQ